MPTKKIFIVFDLGPGDGGKGGVVHKLTRHHNAHTVIKVGGAQGSHGVNNGSQKFAFSQWGCGTLEGVKTHITQLMVISPEGLLNEAQSLKYSVGVTDAFDLLTVDERAICATPYHGIVSRIKEICRRDNPRGTIGTGMGEAFRDSTKHPTLTIRASDLAGDLRHKLELVREQALAVADVASCGGGFSEEDLGILREEAALLKDDGFLDHVVERFCEVGKLLNVVPVNYTKAIFDKDGVAVVDSSHGVLTDSKCGLVPHVSAIRTLPRFTYLMLRDAGFEGEIHSVGVHRAYSIRHGAGPLPTAQPNMNNKLLPGSHKKENRWQGKVRVGPLDLVLLKFAIATCGVTINSLAITWFDQILKNGTWQICRKYKNPDNRFFENDGQIKVAYFEEELTAALFECVPEISSIGDLPKSKEDLGRFCHKVLDEELGAFSVPVRFVSFGPTDQDKLLQGRLK